jgi:excisionase family DNA binding protein
METLFTKKEVAAYLKVSERTVDREIDRLRLEVYKVGRSVRIPESSLKQMLGGGGLSDATRGKTIRELYED